MACRMVQQLCGIALLAVIAVFSSQSQDQWAWPENPKNLQVLNKDWPGSRLSPIMRGFTRSLGVRCTHCHVGEEGKPLTTYDFASDANPNKDRAREMLRMLGSVNDHLKKIKSSGDKPVNMWCHTCHRGRPRPLTLGEELGEQYRAKGIDAALEHYADLKLRYYARGAYDFGERSLNDLGFELLGKGDAAAAIKIFKLNTDEYPKSANTWDSLAEGYMKAGDTKLAKQYYEKVLEMDPKSENAKEMLKKLKEGSPK